MNINPSQLDELTGCYTRKAFQDYLRKLLSVVEPDQSPLGFSLSLLDIDHFLQVN